jgi:hypothetical protein
MRIRAIREQTSTHLNSLANMHEMRDATPRVGPSRPPRAAA